MIPEKGVRLVSFAVHWIRAEIHEFILKNWRIVKIATTKAQRKLFFNLRSKKQNTGWLTDEEAKKIAKDLDVSVKEVMHMENRLNSNDAVFLLTFPLTMKMTKKHFLQVNILKIIHLVQKS